MEKVRMSRMSREGELPALGSRSEDTVKKSHRADRDMKLAYAR